MPDLPTGFENCTAGGLKYHIHKLWTYGDSQTEAIGETDCGSTPTAGHYDPYAGNLKICCYLFTKKNN